MGLHMIDQHKTVNNSRGEGDNTLFSNCFTNKYLKSMAYIFIQIP